MRWYFDGAETRKIEVRMMTHYVEYGNEYLGNVVNYCVESIDAHNF